MNKYQQEILERIYQSYVCGGDSLNFKLKKDPHADKTAAAIEELEREEYITVVSRTEYNIKAAAADKGIAFGNSAV
ncbi:MAG: hypothetical protein LUC97_04210 [Clostridiales bacterium]|nr:hypothetical protein [Clostridiales bacterium]